MEYLVHEITPKELESETRTQSCKSVDIFSDMPQRHPEYTCLRLNHEPATMAHAYNLSAHRAVVGEFCESKA